MTAFALPKGSSLEQRTLDLFHSAGLRLHRHDNHAHRARLHYHGDIDAVFYKPREIPLVVAAGKLDFGITGGDWIEETAADVESVGALNYTKAGARSWRLVLAVPSTHPATTAMELPDDVRIATEYPNITAGFFKERGKNVEIVHSYGATEAKIPELADAVVDVVDTGSSLRGNDLRVLATIRSCTPHIIANPESMKSAVERERITGIARLLGAVETAQSRIMLTVCVNTTLLRDVSRMMPETSWHLGCGIGGRTVVLQGLFRRERIGEEIDRLLACGALSVVETDVVKVVESGAGGSDGLSPASGNLVTWRGWQIEPAIAAPPE